MRKTLVVILLLISMCFILTGCVKNEDREAVLKTLEKEGYIKSDWDLIDKTTDDGLFGATGYMYIYEDDRGDLYSVVIDTDSKDEEKLYVSLYANTTQEKIAKIKTDEDDEFTYLYERGDLFEKLVLRKGMFSWNIE